MRKAMLLIAVGALGLSGCDQVNSAAEAIGLKKPPPPAPAPPPANPVRERAEPISWDEGFGAFWYNDRPLSAARSWTFDRDAQGFSGSVTISTGINGVEIANRLPDSLLRSPSGLGVDGSRFPLVLVRLTRLSEAPPWDGLLAWSTAGHPEGASYYTKPFLGDAPQVNETVILAYDMSNPKKGGDDWVKSIIDQIRIDTDDGAGSRFRLRQIAIVENPDPAKLKAPPWPVAKTAAAVGLR
jgi:hypothetical protein